ncbi:MAG: hypothetical protein IME93_03190 [Proteobacteria bacterium]|nr:hypothetical protein [Pseudomonadota bacterium]
MAFLAPFLPAISAAASVFGIISAVSSANTQKKMAEKRAAARARERARQADRLRGKQLARFSKGNVRNEGTALIVQEETLEDLASDLENIKLQTDEELSQIAAARNKAVVGGIVQAGTSLAKLGAGGGAGASPGAGAGSGSFVGDIYGNTNTGGSLIA